jgi:hypothetical protein
MSKKVIAELIGSDGFRREFLIDTYPELGYQYPERIELPRVRYVGIGLSSRTVMSTRTFKLRSVRKGMPIYHEDS